MKALAQALISGLQAQAAVHALIVFGSRARGDAHDQSDTDVMIIADFPSPRAALRIQAVKSICPDCNLDAFCYTPEEFDQLFHTYVEGTHDAPPLLGMGIATETDSEIVMYAVADGIVLHGKEFLAPYCAQHAQYVRDGLVKPIPRYSPFPDVRDGLFTTQRRLIYTLLHHFEYDETRFPKCGRIIDCCRELYHPFGVMHPYNDLVQMAQPFRARYPLIVSRGNFGTMYPDPPAAPRYTEAMLSPMIHNFTAEIHEWVPNYRDTLQEPVFLPFRFPNLLINGTLGPRIADRGVLPPYNLREVCDGLLALLENPQLNFEDLDGFVPAPDFPTGGQLLDRKGIRHVMQTGSGEIKLRGTVFFQDDGDSRRLVVPEVPYTVGLTDLSRQIESASNQQLLPGVSRFVDGTTHRSNIRLELSLHPEANAEATIGQLFEYTDLEISIPVDTTIVDEEGTTRRLTLLQMMHGYLDQRRTFLLNSKSVDAKTINRRLREEIIQVKEQFGDARRTRLPN